MCPLSSDIDVNQYLFRAKRYLLSNLLESP